MPFESLSIANEILKTARDRDLKLTPLQLVKLAYFAHGYCLGIFDRPLINEQVEAWQYGPVIRSVYHEFKKYGNSPIKSRARRLCAGPGGFVPRPWAIDEGADPELQQIAKSVIAKVVEHFGARSGLELSSLTHKAGTPWRQVYDQYGGNLPKGTDIPEALIKEYFSSISPE